MKWIKRIFKWLGLLLLLGIIFLVGSVAYDSFFGAKTADYTNTTYTAADGTELLGYLAMPEGDGNFPAVLLIHEWWGLNPGITILADALAEEGYVVFAPDAYRGKTTKSVARALYLRLGTPEEEVFADVDAALNYMMDIDSVNPDRVASMGFCFGGGHSLQLGMRQSEKLAVTIMYYGAVVTNPDLLRPLTDGQPVLGIFGADDQSIPTAEVLEFEAALNTLEIPNDITIYEGVGHAFLNEENFEEAGTAGDAWQQTLEFLEQEL